MLKINAILFPRQPECSAQRHPTITLYFCLIIFHFSMFIGVPQAQHQTRAFEVGLDVCWIQTHPKSAL